jgi:hypothetical protein
VAERAEYAPGTFCWTDLAAAEPGVARDFYCGLFGWEAHELPMGARGSYVMMTLEGKPVCAIAAQPEQQRAAGVPSMWNSYVCVDSADELAARAEQLGASVHAPPFDVMDAGRMAVIQDPQGAFFEIWEPRGHFGAALVNAPAALVWNELSTSDQDAAAGFYCALFGWSVEEFPGMENRYLTLLNDGASNGGILHGLMPPHDPPHWLVYFGVDVLDGALIRAAALGATVQRGPMEIPVARIAFLIDPQGARFALYDGELDP